MAEAGAVAWQFDQRGVVVAQADPGSLEDLAMAAIDAGAEDFETNERTLQVYSPAGDLESIRRTLAGLDAVIVSSEMAMLPRNTVALDEGTAKQNLRLLDQLEDLDDIQRVYSNADFPDAVLAEYGGE